jgi:hypothetical protein
MLIAALAIWLTLVLFFVALCRGAASADGRDSVSAERYPTASANGLRADVAGLVLWEEQPMPVLRDLRPRVPGAQGRAGQYAAGS